MFVPFEINDGITALASFLVIGGFLGSIGGFVKKTAGAAVSVINPVLGAGVAVVGSVIKGGKKGAEAAVSNVAETIKTNERLAQIELEQAKARDRAANLARVNAQTVSPAISGISGNTLLLAGVGIVAIVLFLRK